MIASVCARARPRLCVVANVKIRMRKSWQAAVHELWCSIGRFCLGSFAEMTKCMRCGELNQMWFYHVHIHNCISLSPSLATYTCEFYGKMM